MVVHLKWFISNFKQGDKLLKIHLCWTRSSLSSDLLLMYSKKKFIQLSFINNRLIVYILILLNDWYIFLGGSFLTPINSTVADFLLQEDCAMCEPALHFPRNFLRQVLHFQSNFSSVSIPNFAKKSAFFQN